MKILVLSDGASIHTERWLLGMKAAGVDFRKVSLITMNPEEVRNGISSEILAENIYKISPGKIKIGGGNWIYLIYLLKIKFISQKIKPDVIISVYLTSYGFVASLIKGKTFLVHYMMGSDVMVALNKGWLYKITAKFSLWRADMLVSASNTMTNKIKGFAAVDDSKVLTQQYGLENWILLHGSKEKRYTFISNRAWVKNSNIPYVLKLFENAGPNRSLALVSSDNSQVDIDTIKLLENSNIYLFNSMAHTKMVDLVSQSEYFFSLTSSDGTSLSLLEAMAVGCIPIVSDIPANKEWVIDGYNGFLIDLFNEEKAIFKIREALSLSEKEKKSIRQINKNIVDDRADCQRNMKLFYNKLQTLKQSCRC